MSKIEELLALAVLLSIPNCNLIVSTTTVITANQIVVGQHEKKILSIVAILKNSQKLCEKRWLK